MNDDYSCLDYSNHQNYALELGGVRKPNSADCSLQASIGEILHGVPLKSAQIGRWGVGGLNYTTLILETTVHVWFHNQAKTT